MLLLLLERLLNLCSDLELVLYLFIGDFVYLGLFEVISDILSGCKVASDLDFLFDFWDFGEDPDEILIVVSASKSFKLKNRYQA